MKILLDASASLDVSRKIFGDFYFFYLLDLFSLDAQCNC